LDADLAASYDEFETIFTKWQTDKKALEEKKKEYQVEQDAAKKANLKTAYDELKKTFDEGVAAEKTAKEAAVEAFEKEIKERKDGEKKERDDRAAKLKKATDDFKADYDSKFDALATEKEQFADLFASKGKDDPDVKAKMKEIGEKDEALRELRNKFEAAAMA